MTFLSEVESPYEVHDYIRSYLGDSKEVKEFAKQYLERRSKARNAQKEREVEDDILAPAPAVNPTSTEFQEVKVKKWFYTPLPCNSISIHVYSHISRYMFWICYEKPSFHPPLSLIFVPGHHLLLF